MLINNNRGAMQSGWVRLFNMSSTYQFHRHSNSLRHRCNLNSATAESRFLEPPGETKVSSGKQVGDIKSKNVRFD